MKAFDKDELARAFMIPEPVRRSEFMSSLGLAKTKPRRPHLAMFIRLASAVLIIAEVIVIGVILRKAPEGPDDIGLNSSVTDSLTQPTTGESTVTVTTQRAADFTSLAETQTTTAALSAETSAQTITATDSADPAVTDGHASQTEAAVYTEAPQEQTAPQTEYHEPETTVTTTLTFDFSPVGNDLTVTPNVIYDIGSSPMIATRKYELRLPPEGLNSNEAIAQLMFDDSDLIVIGTPVRTVNTGLNAEPYVQEDIVIGQCIKGSLNAGDTISLYREGFYLTLEMYAESCGIDLDVLIQNGFDSAWVKYSPEKFTPEAGEVYLYCLSKAGGELPDGAYTFTGFSECSRFLLSGNIFTSAAQPYYGVDPVTLSYDDVLRIAG